MTPPIIIDIEASGFGRDSYPIEIGFVLESGSSWCSLIRPEEEWLHWDEGAEKVHQISRELLVEHGKSASLIAQQLNDLLINKTVYSDSWVHDFIWMSRLFDVAETSAHFNFKDIREILTPYQEAIWHQTRAQVELQLDMQRHRASADARVIQLTWLRTLAES
jgi:hypothetical protein